MPDRTILPACGEGEDHFLSAASFLHSERNFLRSLPFRPLASASLEHSTDSAVCGLAILSVGAMVSDFLASSVLAAGAVCANAVPASRRDARAATAAREAMVIVKTPMDWKGPQLGSPRLNSP